MCFSQAFTVLSPTDADDEEEQVDPQPKWLAAYCNERIPEQVRREDVDSALEFIASHTEKDHVTV